MPELATVATFGFPDFDPPVILDLYHRLGCTSSQFYRNPANPPADADAIAICRDAGVPITSLHGVFGPDIDPSSPDEAVRRRSVDRYIGEGELALRLGGRSVVVHPSPLMPSPPPLREADEALRRDQLRKSMAELAALGAKQGVTFLIENLPNEGVYGRDAVQIAAMVRSLATPHLRMCLDLGHAFITSSAIDRLRDCADVVDYLHVHDNDGRADAHLMPGDGAIDWPAVGRTLRETGLEVPAMLEVFYLRDKLEELAASDLPGKLAQWLAVR